MARTDGPALLPYAFRTVGAHRMVSLIDPARLDWRHGFFVRSLPESQPLDAIEPFENWRARTAVPADFSHVGGIYHVSRCGSTLLAQNLKATGKAVVLSEPPFMRVLRTGFDDTLSPDEAAEAGARVIGQWRDWAMAQGKALVVKFNSQTHQWREPIAAALPGARFAFLHREPTPVFESIHRGPPQYLQRDIAQARHDGVSELDSLDEDPLMLAAARRYCAALDAFADADEDVFEVAYPDLAGRFAALCEYFGLATGGTAEWDPAIDAKALEPGSGKPYRPVGDERLSRFATDHEELLAVAEARYRSFLDARGAPGRTRGEAAT